MKLGRRELLYLSLMGFAAALSLVRTVVFASCMGPEEIGYLSLVLTVSSLGALLQLGAVTGLSRELPVCLGRRENSRAARLVGEATWVIFVSHTVGLLFGLGGILLFGGADTNQRNWWLLSIGLSTTTAVFQLAMLRLRAEQRVMTFSLIQLFCSYGIVTVGIVLIQHWTYVGAVVAICMVNTVVYVMTTWRILSPAVYCKFRFYDVVYLIRIGFPAMVAGLMYNMVGTMDRFFVKSTYGVAELGLYHIGALPLAFGFMASSVVAQYVMPQVLYRYGQEQSLRVVFQECFQVALVVLVVFLVLMPVAIPVGEFCVIKFLPQYEAAVPLFIFFYIGAAFLAANTMSIVKHAANRQMIFLVESAIVLLVMIIAWIVAVKLRVSLKSFAAINMCGHILYFVLSTTISFKISTQGDPLRISSTVCVIEK